MPVRPEVRPLLIDSPQLQAAEYYKNCTATQAQQTILRANGLDRHVLHA